MTKLLLLALLGLVLGGGIWKAQNPDGTLDDLKSQSVASMERLKAGVDTVVDTQATDPGQESLDDRVAAMEQQLADVSADDRAAESEEILTVVDEKLAASNDSLSSVQDTLDERSASMETMTTAVAELDTALQETRARTDASNVRLDTIDRRFDLLVQRLDEQTTESDLGALRESLETLQSQVGDIQSSMQESDDSVAEAVEQINEKTDNLELRFDTLTSAAESIDNEGSPNQNTLSASVDSRLSGIEQRLATVNADSRKVETLSEQLVAAREKIAELEQQDSDARQSLEQLNSSVDALNTANESISIDAIQTQISDQLALARSQFDSSENNANTEQLDALLEVTRNRIQTLEQRVQELPASSNEADGAQQTQSDLQAQIAELEQRLETLTSSEPALANTVNDVKQQVEQLSAQGFVTRDDLRDEGESQSIEYKIYFDYNSAAVTEDAATVLDSFIAQEKNRTTGISIFGFTDRSGSAAYNQQLAIQRATSVRSYLIQNGIDFTKIKALTGLGEDAAAAVLPDESFEPEQRVVVLYAAQP
ncbi:OmpA family protein [bacterium]|nr:OmpA family protein [bacterium]